VAPTGTVAFTSSDGVLNGYTACATAPLTATKANPALNIPAGSSIATCTVQFPITEPLGTGTTVATNCSKTPPSGQVCVTATYNGDTNFGMATYNFAQVVQNYGVAFTAPAAGTPVIVTQDFSNATDLFNPAPIAAQVTSSGGFSDPLTVTCSVTAVSVANIPAGQAVSDPSCAPSSAALSGVSGSTLTYSISASTTAPIGAYSVQLTATDLNTKAGYSISQSTMASLTVNVVGQTPALTLAQGATGAESLVFNTASAASGSTLLSFGCGKIFTSDGVSVPNPSNAPVVTCTDSSIPSGGVPVGSNGLTTVPIQVSLATTTAQINRSSTVSLAALLGVPLLALIGWFGSRKSPRRNFFRFIGLILLMAGAAYAVTGCGGSFTQTGGIPGQGGLGKGTYLVQVIAYDGSKQTGNQYYAVVPLTVTANSAQ